MNHDGWMLLLTLVIALATVATACIMRNQYNVMLRAFRANVIQVRSLIREISDSEKSFQIGSRAWVGFVKGGAVLLTVGKPYELQAFIQNTGKTPALKVSARLFATMSQKAEEFKIVKEELESYGNICAPMFPSSKVRLVHIADNPLTSEDVEGIMNETLVLRVLVRVHYFDVFGVKHKTIATLQLHAGTGMLYTMGDMSTAD